VALFDVIAGVLVVGVLGQESLIGRIQAKLWYVFIVHQTEPLIAMLDESDVRLNQSRGGLVVALPRTRIERLDELQRWRNRVERERWAGPRSQASERERSLIYRPRGRRGRRNWRRSNFDRQFMSRRYRRCQGAPANLRRRPRSVFPA